MVLAVGSTPTFAASPSDVAIGLVTGDLIGAAIDSNSPQPIYAAPAYVAPAPAYAAAYATQAPVYATPAPVYAAPYMAPAPTFWIDGYGYRHYYHHHHDHLWYW